MAEPVPVIAYRPETEQLTRPVRVLAVQNGAGSRDKGQNIQAMEDWMRTGLEGYPADFVVFCELATTMYFAGTTDPSWQDEAETIPGPTTEVFSRLAAEHNVNVVLSLYERGPRSREFYNSTVFLDRKGQIIPGILADGSQVACYRKTHIPNNLGIPPVTNEKFFFRPGPGLPVFKTDVGTVGCLICYDRSFPEAWRVLSLSGAEIIFLPTASATPRRYGSFQIELQTAALQNGVFIVAVNKGGVELLDDERSFFGLSCLVAPSGELRVACPARQGPVLMRAEFDLADRAEYNRKYHYFRDRRPELYGVLSQLSFV